MSHSNSTCPKLNLSLFLPKWTPLSVCLQYRNGNTIHLPHHTNQNWEVILEYFSLILPATSNCQWGPTDSASKLPLTFISFSICLQSLSQFKPGWMKVWSTTILHDYPHLWHPVWDMDLNYCHFLMRKLAQRGKELAQSFTGDNQWNLSLVQNRDFLPFKWYGLSDHL